MFIGLSSWSINRDVPDLMRRNAYIAWHIPDFMGSMRTEQEIQLRTQLFFRGMVSGKVYNYKPLFLIGVSHERHRSLAEAYLFWVTKLAFKRIPVIILVNAPKGIFTSN
jgi:hypothetical protein